MKVLVILTGAMVCDGITNSVHNYYAAMDRTDMKVDIVSARSTLVEMEQKFKDIGCRVHRLECRDRNPVIYVLKLVQLIWREKYDIVHAHGNSATLAFEMVAAYLGGCKVRIVHSRNSFCEHTIIDKCLRPVMYATYTDGFACGAKAGKWLFGNRCFTIVNNGKDIEKFLFREDIRREYRKRLLVSPDTILLGHVGLFHKQKNHEFLIEIFSEICQRSDKYKLVLIGDGEELTKIKEKVKNAGLEKEVIFLGRQLEVEKWFQALDIMIFPSWFEGMPNVVLEWQIAGVPSVISDSITTECKITDNVVYLPLEVGAKKWAEKVMTIVPANREGQQEVIRQTFIKEGFDIYTNAVVLKEKYLELISKRKKRKI